MFWPHCTMDNYFSWVDSLAYTKQTLIEQWFSQNSSVRQSNKINPSWCGLFGGVFWDKWSLSFLNFHSNEKYKKFRKISTISSIFIKTFWNFFWWKIWLTGFFCVLFWLDVLSKKWMTTFSAPYGLFLLSSANWQLC